MNLGYKIELSPFCWAAEGCSAVYGSQSSLSRKLCFHTLAQFEYVTIELPSGLWHR